MSTENPRSGRRVANEAPLPSSAAGGGLGGEDSGLWALGFSRDSPPNPQEIDRELPALAAGMLVVMPSWLNRGEVWIWRVTDEQTGGAELVAIVGDARTAVRLMPKGWTVERWGSDSYWKKPP